MCITDCGWQRSAIDSRPPGYAQEAFAPVAPGRALVAIKPVAGLLCRANYLLFRLAIEPVFCLISAGPSHLARRLSGPAFARMRECAHVIKAEQPGDLRYMHLTVIEVTKCQIVPQLMKYFSEV